MSGFCARYPACKLNPETGIIYFWICSGHDRLGLMQKLILYVYRNGTFCWIYFFMHGYILQSCLTYWNNSICIFNNSISLKCLLWICGCGAPPSLPLLPNMPKITNFRLTALRSPCLNRRHFALTGSTMRMLCPLLLLFVGLAQSASLIQELTFQGWKS